MLTFITFSSYSQVEFEQGYLINNDGKRLECLIKNVDWKNSPTKFQYKLNENSEPITASIDGVSEFGVGFHKF